MDNFELIDRDYSTASNSGRIHSNLIRLKPTSFEGIRNKWKNFRLSRLNKKLEKAEAELENVANTVPFEQMEEKLLAKSKKIAKIEEKIKILSREGVPANYVSNRAIKLKDAMMREILGVSAEAYKDENKAEDYGFSDFENTDFALAAATDINSEGEKKPEEDVQVETISSEDIRNAVNERFAEINGKKETEDDNVIEDDDRTNIDIPVTIATDEEIENEYDRVSSNESTPARTDRFDENGINTSIDDEEFDNSEKTDSSDANIYGFDENGDRKVSPNLFDENGINVKTGGKYDEFGFDVNGIYYKNAQPEVEQFNISGDNKRVDPSKVENYGVGENYKKVSNIFDPMSDDELARARENIEYDKYKEQYEKDSKIRDDIVVTPDRKEDSESKYDEYTVVEENENENDQDMHFDYTNATAKDIENAVNFTTSSADLKAMMARVAELKRKQAESKERMDEAKRIKEEESRRAEESRRILEEKEKEKAAYMSKLKSKR